MACKQPPVIPNSAAVAIIIFDSPLIAAKLIFELHKWAEHGLQSVNHQILFHTQL